MDRRVIYCTGCDRNVEVVVHDEGGQPVLAGAECSEVGWRCLGTSCPICAEPLRARTAVAETATEAAAE